MKHLSGERAAAAKWQTALAVQYNAAVRGIACPTGGRAPREYGLTGQVPS
jgi:hypothetical protein